MWIGSNFAIIAVLVILVRSTAAEGGTQPNLEFHCQPDDTINVTLTSTTKTTYNIISMCEKVMSNYKDQATNETFQVTCTKGKNVTITVTTPPASTPAPSTTAPQTPTLTPTLTPTTTLDPKRTPIKSEISAFYFMCSEIDETGIVKYASLETKDSIDVQNMGKKDPEFDLNMYITQDSNADDHLLSISIGTAYNLHIDGPDNYFIYPDTCSASDGRSINITIMKSGCTCDNEVMTSAFHQSNHLAHEIETAFKGFRFVGSKTVNMECEVTVCPSGGCTNGLSLGKDTRNKHNCLTPFNCAFGRKRSRTTKTGSTRVARTSFVVRDSNSFESVASAGYRTKSASILATFLGICMWSFADRF